MMWNHFPFAKPCSYKLVQVIITFDKLHNLSLPTTYIWFHKTYSIYIYKKKNT